jgi:luciferase-like monooxygenase
MSVREDLERRLTRIPGVTRQPSRRGSGYSYFAGDQEIAHFHGDHRLDVRLTREVIGQRKANAGFDARVRTRGPTADWVAVSVEEEKDIPLAIALVEAALRVQPPG